MLEGRRAKARRGELGKAVPMGYLRRPSGEVVFDPDQQAQATIRLVFDLFERLRTIGKVLRYLVEHDIRMPVRARGMARKDELEWHRPNRPTLQNLLANPIYAGAYVYGVRPTDRRRQKVGRPSTGRRLLRAQEADVFLPDRLPAYITWGQYQRNQAQLQSNRAAWGGAPRAGSALLCGVITCGRCGMRMTAHYNNNGRAARYVCMSMKSNYGEPFCQSLTAAPLDGMMTRLVLQALQPAALETSLALAADLEAERAALDQHWQQRLERACYEVERARRQYNACEPENRLVARSLERAWEEALAEQTRLEADYERVRRERLAAPSSAELLAIRNLAQDLPTLWRAETTTQEERQTIVRLLLERVLVEVVHNTEQVRVICHWHGGNRTLHQLTRPVARLATLSTYASLVARAADLRRDGRSFAEIADILNQEGWRPAKRRNTFNAPMVHHLLIKARVVAPKYRRSKPPIVRQPDEWTIRELAEQIGVPEPTLYSWINKGRLRSRFVQAGRGRAKLVHADADTIAALKDIRATPPPWRRLPPPFTQHPDTPTTES
jgi:excisionase family DNA binding protein